MTRLQCLMNSVLVGVLLGGEQIPAGGDTIADYRTGKGEYVSLNEYVDRMQPEQKDIYFLTGDSRATIDNSPHLEVFKKKDVEVLFMTEPVDEFILPGFGEYSDKTPT